MNKKLSSQNLIRKLEVLRTGEGEEEILSKNHHGMGIPGQQECVGRKKIRKLYGQEDRTLGYGLQWPVTTEYQAARQWATQDSGSSKDQQQQAHCFQFSVFR
jgi:hypothetical protein